MRGVLDVSRVVSGLLILAAGSLLTGCDEASDQNAMSSLDTVPGEPKVQVQKATLPPADIPMPATETPLDAGTAPPESVSKPAAESATAQQADAESSQPTVEELKQALLARGWREVPGEDGSVFLMPPESTP